MKPCVYYSQGLCHYGSSCRNYHDTSTHTAASASALSDLEKLNLSKDKSIQPRRPTKICTFFQKGTCTKGTKCLFQHPQRENDVQSQPEPASVSFEQPANTTVDSRNGIPCRYFASNSCQKGLQCPFLHEGVSLESNQETDAPADDIDEKDDHRRTFLGALVQFGEEGQVLKVSLNEDFSSIRIAGALGNITKLKIQDLLRELQFDNQETQIRVFVEPTKSLTTSVVTVEDANFAKTFENRLKARKKLLPKYSVTEFSTVDNVEVFGSINRRTSSRKVRISWQKPLPRRAWLNFGSELIATRVSSAFSSGKYKILGQRVTAEPPQRSSSTFRASHNHVPWTVVLNDIPHNATEDLIKKSIFRVSDEPRHIELSQSSYNTSSARRSIETLFVRLSSIEFHELPPKPKYFNASVIFRSDSDALEAVESVKTEQLEYLKGGRFMAKQLSSAKFKTSTSVYNALQTQIDDLERGWTGERFINFKYFHATDTSTKLTTIKLEGEIAKHVAEASHSLEAILEGKVIQYHGSPFWNSALATNGEAYQSIQDIQKTHKIVVLRNRARKLLLYFGPVEKHALVEELITARRSDTDASSAQEMLLSKEEFAWACQGGIKQIIGSIGAEAVSFDVVSVPKKIAITGTKQQFQTAESMVRHRTTHVQDTESNCDCSICWTDADSPVTTKCGHLYCLECFGDMCSAVGTQTDDFQIRCQGDMGKCQQCLHLSELQEHLSSSAVEELLQASLKSHISQHREQLKYCPTPDCGHLYRATETANTMTCTKCLQCTCTKCHQQHGLLSCADYRDLQSGGYEAFEKLKKELGIKDCPKCKTPIEKTEGCNHMTCISCKTHICWVCLKTFDSSGPCYAHMNVEHGGHSDFGGILDF